MTVGTPWKKIVAFMIPMLIGNIAQQMYNTVDSIVVGRYVGDNALAAVGSAGPIFQLLLVLFAGIAVGAGLMVSQYFGGITGADDSVAVYCAASAGASGYTGEHYRLVRLVSYDSDDRNRRACLL